MTLLYLTLSSLAQAEVGETRNFNVIDPASWSYTAGAIDDMAQNWGAGWPGEAGHEITYGVVEDADEAGIFYFATRRDNGTGGTMVSIFRYDTSTYQFARLMRIDNAGDAAWYVAGYDTGYVVYAEASGGYDRGTCGEPIIAAIDGVDGALYKLPDSFDRSWSEGASAYTTNDADTQTARDRQTTCEQANTGTP